MKQSAPIILFDTPAARIALRPFSYTRTLSQLRIGVTTVAEKWAQYMGVDDLRGGLGCNVLYASAYPNEYPGPSASFSYGINSTILPNPLLVEAICGLKSNEVLMAGDVVIAFLGDREAMTTLQEDEFGAVSAYPRFKWVRYNDPYVHIKHPWDMLRVNADVIQEDVLRFVLRGASAVITDKHTVVYGGHQIFIEPGVTLRAAVLNAEEGPIYIGKDAQIHERAVLQGPVAVCAGARIHAGAVVGKGTVVGPCSKVGGEVAQSIILGYSNKAHEGYLGNSVVGMWCNLGAGTNTSNLRNDYGNVTVWDYTSQGFVATNQQFCGLFMGDHSKCGINTMFNTGTVVGVSANVFGSGYCNRFIPSFSWGSGRGSKVVTYKLDKALLVAARCMQRRSQQLTEMDKQVLAHIHEITAPYREGERGVV